MPLFRKKDDQVSQTYPSSGLPKDFFSKDPSKVYWKNPKYPSLYNRVTTGSNFRISDHRFQSNLLSKDLYFGEYLKEGSDLLEMQRNYLRVFEGGFIYSIRIDGDTITKTLEETIWTTM